MTKVQRDRITVGERPKVTTDILDESAIELNWKTSLLKKNLKYDLSRCVGCSLCLPCPWEAITLGPVKEVAAGRLEGAPLVIIDEDKCTFCGLCDSACIFNAIEACFDDIPADTQYARLKGKHELDESKCAPCLLCAKICPREAIKVDLKVTPKTKLVKYRSKKSTEKVAAGTPEAKGTIAIDENKCTWCGLCELLCPECITIYWTEERPKPPNFSPAVGIRIDATHCDYCGLCETICPSEAIKVKCTTAPPRTILEPVVEGKMTIDDSLCVDCTLCAQKCPYKALDVTLPLTGKVQIEHLERCDPTGCVNCFNICPTKAIFPTGDENKLKVIEENCVFCGACENACPEEVLKVTRESYQLSQLEKARDWEHARAHQFYEPLIGRLSQKSDLYERNIQAPTQTETGDISLTSKNWSKTSPARQKVQTSIRQLQSILKNNWRLHLHFEKGRIDQLRNAFTKIVKRKSGKSSDNGQ
ncbi:MAG: 4Fe-4S binding protein [Promethearchaeota archaeon]